MQKDKIVSVDLFISVYFFCRVPFFAINIAASAHFPVFFCHFTPHNVFVDLRRFSLYLHLALLNARFASLL